MPEILKNRIKDKHQENKDTAKQTADHITIGAHIIEEMTEFTYLVFRGQCDNKR